MRHSIHVGKEIGKNHHHGQQNQHKHNVPHRSLKFMVKLASSHAFDTIYNLINVFLQR